MGKDSQDKTREGANTGLFDSRGVQGDIDIYIDPKKDQDVDLIFRVDGTNQPFMGVECSDGRHHNASAAKR